jgi:phosphoglycolate phosphatase
LQPSATPPQGAAPAVPAHLLFDLDGTLTDPLVGIARCIASALAALGAPCPPPAELRWAVGPPLRDSLAALLGPAREGEVGRALALYRERFASVGLYENRVYPGIPEALAGLRGRGLALWVCTAKPAVYARRILAHFGLHPHFRGVYGSELDGRRTDKRELLGWLLERERLPVEATLMIGDRDVDMAAARAHGLRAIGAAWGYGGPEELRRAGAHLLVEEPAALLRQLAPP